MLCLPLLFLIPISQPLFHKDKDYPLIWKLESEYKSNCQLLDTSKDRSCIQLKSKIKKLRG